MCSTEVMLYKVRCCPIPQASTPPLSDFIATSDSLALLLLLSFFLLFLSSASSHSHTLCLSWSVCLLPFSPFLFLSLL